MDAAGIPWNIVAAIATPIVAAIGWLGRKAWGIAEKHAERRTVAFEAIAPSIQKSFEKMQQHVTSHADEHAKAVRDAESTIVEAVTASETRLIAEIGVSKRLAVIEAAVIGERKDQQEAAQTSPERSESRPPTAHSSGVQRLRPSRPGVAT